MSRIITIFLIFFLVSFTQSEYKTIDFQYFKITVPSGWQKIQDKGFDSFVGRIAIDEKDTISFDLGWYSNSLDEEENFIINDGFVEIPVDSLSMPQNTVYKFVGHLDSIEIDSFKLNKYSYSEIYGYKAKIVRPKNSGRGLTGIYIDSLWKSGSFVDKFQLNGQNLKPENEEQLLKAIKTLEFFIQE